MHSKNQKRHSSPVPSRTPVVPVKPRPPPAPAHSPGDSLAFRVPKDFPHSRFSKAPLTVYPPKGARSKSCVSLPVVSLEKMSCLSQADSASHVRLTSSSSSSPSSHHLKHTSLSPAASPRAGKQLVNGRGGGGGGSGSSTLRSSPSPSSLVGRPGPVCSPLDRSPSLLHRRPSPSSSQHPLPSASSPMEEKNQNGTETACRSHTRLSGRVFDPNKHCGVQDPETKRPCTRSLTCKTHSLSHRRAVPGRRKRFDVLLAEHKGRNKERDQDRDRDGGGDRDRDRGGDRDGGGDREGLQGVKVVSTPSVPSQEPACPNGRAASTLKLHLSHTHVPRVPGAPPPTSTPPSAASAAFPAPAFHPEPPAHSWLTAAGGAGRLSSDDGDGEPAGDDRAALHVSSQHPQPAAVCVFSSRLMGHGHFVFDRRWDRMRWALQSMVEKHLNAQMWRKVPLAAESVLPSIGPPSLSLPPPAVRPAAQPLAAAAALGKARNGTHRATQPSRETEDSLVGAKKRKNSSYSSFSSSFLSTDHHKRNGGSCHPLSPSARKKEAGLRSGSEEWSPRGDGSHSSSSASSSSSREPDSVPQPPPPPPPRSPSAQRAEGRKRRSPGSYRGRSSTARGLGGPGGLYGTGGDSGGVLASGPASPTQAVLLH